MDQALEPGVELPLRVGFAVDCQTHWPASQSVGVGVEAQAGMLSIQPTGGLTAVVDLSPCATDPFASIRGNVTFQVGASVATPADDPLPVEIQAWEGYWDAHGFHPSSTSVSANATVAIAWHPHVVVSALEAQGRPGADASVMLHFTNDGNADALVDVSVLNAQQAASAGFEVSLPDSTRVPGPLGSHAARSTSFEVRLPDRAARFDLLLAVTARSPRDPLVKLNLTQVKVPVLVQASAAPTGALPMLAVALAGVTAWRRRP